MEKMYIINESRLKYLIEQDAILQALEAGGVDNWCWYGESKCEYLEEYKKEEKIEESEDFDFESLAEREIKVYKEAK